MQRAMRFNPTSKKLWLEYFRLELLYAEKLLKRREILLQAKVAESDDTPDAVLEGKVANIVYRQATETFTDDVDIVLSFLDICQKFNFAASLAEQIIKDLQSKYANHPKTWNALARLHLMSSDKDRIEKFQAVFEEAVQTLQNEEIWRLYIEAFQELTEEEGAKKRAKRERREKLLGLYQRAAEADCISPDLYCKWTSLLVQSDKADVAQSVIETAVTQHPECMLLWKHRLQLMIGSQTDEGGVLKTFRKARKSVKDKDTLPLWQLVIDYCIACKSQKLQQLFEEGSLSCPEVSQYIKVIYLEWTFLCEGIVATRQLYTRLLRMKPLPLKFFMTYAKIESTLPKPDITHQRQAYEDAVMEYGETESDLWLDYISLEEHHPDGQPENISQLYFRAKSTLIGQNNEDFITKYSLKETEN